MKKCFANLVFLIAYSFVFCAAGVNSRVPRTADSDGNTTFASASEEKIFTCEDLIKAYDEAKSRIKNKDKKLDDLPVRDLRAMEKDYNELLRTLTTMLEDTQEKLEDLSCYTGSVLPFKNNVKNPLTFAENKNNTQESMQMPVDVDGKTYDVKDGTIVVSAVADVGEIGGASAFFAKYKGKNFIFTNWHVAAEDVELVFKTVDGEKIKNLSKGFLAKGKDLFIFPISEIPNGAASLPLIEDYSEIRAGDEIIVCGNSDARSVLLKTRGKVVAVGPDIVEIDSPIYQGNSGGPVYHVKSGKVIGVVSHFGFINKNSPNGLVFKEEKGKSAINNRIRYFAQRVDTVKDSDWEGFTLDEIRKQVKIIKSYAEKLAKIKAYTEKSVILSNISYPDFDKFIQMYDKSRRYGASSKRRADAQEYTTMMIRLLSQEMATLRAKKFITPLQDEQAQLLKAFAGDKAFFEMLQKQENP